VSTPILLLTRRLGVAKPGSALGPEAQRCQARFSSRPGGSALPSPVQLSTRRVNDLECGNFSSRRDVEKIARHFSAGIMHQVKDESHRDD